MGSKESKETPVEPAGEAKHVEDIGGTRRRRFSTVSLQQSGVGSVTSPSSVRTGDEEEGDEEQGVVGRGVGGGGGSDSVTSSSSSSPRSVPSEFEIDLQSMEFFKMVTLFEEGEIRVMHERFVSMDPDENFLIQREKMMEIEEFKHHPLRARIISLLDLPEYVDFEAFLKSLSIFAFNTSRDEKSKFAFRVWDMDGDGVLNASDLEGMLKAVVGEELEEVHIKQVVERIIEEQKTPLNDSGEISYDAFVKITLDAELHEKLTFPIL